MPVNKPTTKPQPAANKGAPVPPEKQRQPLAKIQSKPLATTFDPEADAGIGQDKMTRQDFAIPQLVVLQDLSPQVKKTEQGYIKGAQVGMICDPLGEQLWDGEKGVLVLPVSYRRAFVEWVPRTKGGGFVADHGSDDTILQKTTKHPDTGANVLPSGNTISQVAEYFVFLLDDEGGFSPFVLRMAGSQLKKSRRWNTEISRYRVPSSKGGTYNPAMFYRTYLLTTLPERNDKGSWMGWKIVPDEDVLKMAGGDAIYQAAKDFYLQVQTGDVKAAPPAHDAAPDVEGDDKPM